MRKKIARSHPFLCFPNLDRRGARCSLTIAADSSVTVRGPNTDQVSCTRGQCSSQTNPLIWLVTEFGLLTCDHLLAYSGACGRARHSGLRYSPLRTSRLTICESLLAKLRHPPDADAGGFGSKERTKGTHKSARLCDFAQLRQNMGSSLTMPIWTSVKLTCVVLKYRSGRVISF